MTRETFEQRLDVLSPRQESRIEALVEEYRRDVSDVQTAMVNYSLAGGIPAQRAASVIVQLGETAVESLAAMIADQKLVPETSLCVAMVQGVMLAESMVTGRLKAALTDSRLVPQPPKLRVLEEAGPPYRVCDAAYTKLRLILNPESYLQHLMEKHHFLSLSDAAKNQEIESWLQINCFTRYLEDADQEED